MKRRLIRLIVKFLTRACARLGEPATAANLWAHGEALLNEALEACPVVEGAKKKAKKAKKGKK